MKEDHQLAVRNSIADLTKVLRSNPKHLVAADYKTSHTFSDGLYIRVIEVPADSIIVGEIHNDKHLFVLLRGSCTIASTEGLIKIEAPFISEPEAGSQKVGFIHTDCVFMNVHKTTATNLDELEALITPTLEVL